MPFQTVSRTSTGGYICDLIVHPLSGKRSPMEKGLALIAVIALSIFAVRFFF